MKKILIAAALLLSANVAMCQLFAVGIKGGLNSTKLKMKDVAETAINDANGQKTDKTIMMEEAASDLGFHVGGFARINALVMFVQPEIYYTNMSSHIKINTKDGNVSKSETADVKNHRIDIPVIVGAKFGPARLGLGPVASFNLKSDTKVSDQMKEQIGSGLDGAKNTATFAMQIGAGLDILKKLTLDLRYEFGLSKLGDEVSVGNQSFKTDQRANSFIASIGWMF